MGKLTSIKPTHKAIKTYYQTLQTYRDERVDHEGAVETAFQQLLAETARSQGWTLLPKLKLQVKASVRRGSPDPAATSVRRGSPDPAATKNVYPDGTPRDFFNLRRGFWEAKDTHDDFDVEISKKIAKGYPLNNTIFEDTRTAVLYQNGQELYRLDLTDPRQLASLLNEFYAYTEPKIEGFQQAADTRDTELGLK
jgi:hypothetical protein